MTEYDVIVVGGGAVGAATALACAAALPGRRLAVVEAGPEPAPPTGVSPHVLALNVRSCAYLAQVGVEPIALAGGACPFMALEAYDSDSTGAIAFHADEAHVERLGYIVDAPALAAALRQRAGEVVHGWFDDSPVLALEEIGGGYAMRAGDRWLRAPLVVGADGADSTVRTLAGIATQSWDYGQTALVTRVRAERPHGGVARQWFTPAGPLALLPLPPAEGADLALVWSLERDRAVQLQAEPDEQFAACASRASEYFLGSLTVQGERAARPLRQRRALEYSRAGVALVGDAAHALHPLAGLGINLGLADAFTLAGCLAAAPAAPLGDNAVLARYARARVPENLAVMAAMEAFVRGFGTRAEPLAPLRAMAMKAVARTPVLKRQLLAAALGARPGARGPMA